MRTPLLLIPVLALACTRPAPVRAQRRPATLAPETVPLVLESCSKPPATADGGTAWGSLDKEAIRRVIRANIGAVRTCYERTLGGGEALEGKIPLRFTIANDGAVCAARVEGSTLPDIALGNCIVRAATRWQFPPVNGDGVVLVTYPFIFRAGPGPGDAGTPL